MMNETPASVGYLCLALHAHQPYVLHHGTWPHGMEWLLEAATETYLPLLRMVARLHKEGIPLCINLSLSPILLEQLAHPDFKAELPRYIERKIASAREDAAFFEQANEQHLLYVARHWENIFNEVLYDLEALNGDLVAGFRNASQTGCIELLTSAATHGYVPLLGTDESVHAQFSTAARSHTHHFGRVPTGVWLPEGGYRPAGPWHFPVAPEVSKFISPESTGIHEALHLRAGTETALSQAGLRFTFVDTHLIADAETASQSKPNTGRSLYRPHTIAGSDVAVFARDPRTSVQVWRAQYGYPGDFDYLDFHKKRWPGGHRYWRVTGAGLGMNDKQFYHPDAAAVRSRIHAEHFVQLLADTLSAQQAADGTPPILSAPFDLELFGHWWHEGMQFLENVARVIATGAHGIEAVTGDEYLRRFGTADTIHMSEGSWGAGGDNSVWLNNETSWVYSHIYAAELAVRSASQHPAWTDAGTGERIARQLCRELLLLESSDWTTLITTGAARDYAERRFTGHVESFRELLTAWHLFTATGTFEEATEQSLAALESRDSIFKDIDPAAWRPSSKATSTP